MDLIVETRAKLLRAVERVDSLCQQLEDSEPDYLNGELIQEKHSTVFQQILMKLSASEKMLMEIQALELKPSAQVKEVICKIKDLAVQVLELPTSYNDILQAEND